MIYLRVILAVIFCVGSLMGAEVPCNERALHGRIGASKAFGALIGCVALHHMIGQVWHTADPLRSGCDTFQTRRRATAVRETLCSAIALAALGYVAYKLASDSVVSLNVFFDDDEEEVSLKEKGTFNSL